LRDFLKSEDSGDIARRLGERVRRARRRSRAPSPWLPGDGETGKNEGKTRPIPSESQAEVEPAQASAPVTRTFAAREEVEVWTRRLSSAPAGSSNPPATPAMPDARPRTSKFEVASSGDGSVREPSGISSSKVSRRPKRTAGWLLAAVSLSLLAAAFAFAPRATPPKTNAVSSIAPAAARAPGPSAVRAEPAPVDAPPHAASAAPSPAISVQKSDEGAHARNQPGAPTTSTGAEPEQFGVLKITADPRSAVEISGPHFHQLGQSPIVGLKVPVGKYQVVFRNDTFGAPLSSVVSILTGVSRSVHADFRQAEPAVSVH